MADWEAYDCVCRVCGEPSPFKIVPICVACLDGTQATLEQIMESDS